MPRKNIIMKQLTKCFIISALDGFEIDYDTFALLLGLGAAVAGYALYQVIQTKGRRKRSIENEEPYSKRVMDAVSDLVWHGKLHCFFRHFILQLLLMQ